MDREFDRDHDEEPVVLNTSTANVVVVDNVPKTEMKRYEKLYAVIRKIFTGFGTIIDDGLYIPVEGEPQMTSGYAFIEVRDAGGEPRARTAAMRRMRTPDSTTTPTSHSDCMLRSPRLRHCACCLVACVCSTRPPRWRLALFWRAT